MMIIIGVNSGITFSFFFDLCIYKVTNLLSRLIKISITSLFKISNLFTLVNFFNAENFLDLKQKYLSITTPKKSISSEGNKTTIF